MKLVEVGGNLPKKISDNVMETALEVRYVDDTSEVYKLPMVRML